MRRALLVPLAIVTLVGWSLPATAQDTKTVRGTVSALANDSISVKAGSADMKFSVDDKTVVEASGAGTKARAAATAGKAGPKLSEVLQVGQAVEVSYSGNHASRIRRVTSLGGGAPTRATGTVAAVSADSLTINGSAGGGGTFSQTYIIDPKTNVVAHGATTATAATGRTSVTTLVAKGDTVSVAFREEGGALHASEVRVTAKAPR